LYSDEGARGFLPGFADYPRDRIVEYLQAHDDAALTPTLARKFPGLAAEYGSYGRSCSQCETDYEWSEVEWDENSIVDPVCPECAAAGVFSSLERSI
jgi:hypothetical protein